MYFTLFDLISQFEAKIVKYKKGDRMLYGLEAKIKEDGNIMLNFNGVNNTEILHVIEALMEVIIDKELSKGNTEEELNTLIGTLSSNLKHTIQTKSIS